MTSYVHVNGTTYELASPLNDASAAQLVTRLTSGTGRQQLDVVLERTRTSLSINLETVTTAAAWTKQQQPSAMAVPQRVR